MSIKDLQRDIKKGEGYILSDGTLNYRHLIPKAYDIITRYNMQTELKNEIKKVFTNTDNEDTTIYEPTFYNQYYNNIEISEENYEKAGWLWEDIFDYFNNISPKGYYFSSHEGDGSCFGWWKYEEEEF